MTRRSGTWSRRSFLKSVGVSAATLPFFRLLERSAVDAAAATPPLRFVAFVDPHGTLLDHWRPQSPSGGSAGQTNFTLNFSTPDGLGAILAPFQPIINKVIVLDGLCIAPQAQWEGHGGYAGALTGYAGPVDSNGTPTATIPNASIDQYLASQLGGGTMKPSLVLSNGEDNDYKPVISYDATGKPVPSTSNPYYLYSSLFGGLSASSQSAAMLLGTARNKASVTSNGLTASQLFVQQKSQLDYIQADLARLNARLAPPEQLKLAQHLQAIRDIENQLSAPSMTTGGTGGGTSGGTTGGGTGGGTTGGSSGGGTTGGTTGGGGPATCTVPGSPNIPWAIPAGCDPTQQICSLAQGSPNPPVDIWATGLDTTAIDGTIRTTVCNLLAQAFACDLTRFASFALGCTSDARAMPYVANPPSVAASVPPLLAQAQLQGDCHTTVHTWANFAPPNAGDGAQQMWMIHNYYASVVANFAMALDAIPEGDGTVLDHTCILWIGGMANSWVHQNSNVPCMLIGGASGAFQTGQYLTYGPLSTSTSTGISTTPHNGLLVSILNAFGLPITTYGSPSSSNGPLTGL